MTYEQLQKELIQATKEKNRVKKSVIADVKTTALNIAIEEKHKENVTEDNVLAAMKKYQKACQQQIDMCPDYRPDLMEAFQACMKCITEYLPKQMNEDEVRQAVYNIIASVDIQQTGKGAIMKAVMPRLKGKADGKIISKVVDEIVKKTGE